MTEEHAAIIEAFEVIARAEIGRSLADIITDIFSVTITSDQDLLTKCLKKIGEFDQLESFPRTKRELYAGIISKCFVELRNSLHGMAKLQSLPSNQPSLEALYELSEFAHNLGDLIKVEAFTERDIAFLDYYGGRFLNHPGCQRLDCFLAVRNLLEETCKLLSSSQGVDVSWATNL